MSLDCKHNSSKQNSLHKFCKNDCRSLFLNFSQKPLKYINHILCGHSWHVKGGTHTFVFFSSGNIFFSFLQPCYGLSLCFGVCPCYGFEDEDDNIALSNISWVLKKLRPSVSIFWRIVKIVKGEELKLRRPQIQYFVTNTKNTNVHKYNILADCKGGRAQSKTATGGGSIQRYVGKEANCNYFYLLFLFWT